MAAVVREQLTSGLLERDLCRVSSRGGIAQVRLDGKKHDDREPDQREQDDHCLLKANPLPMSPFSSMC